MSELTGIRGGAMKKSDILLEADYRYNFDRAMYINRPAKKAFSIEFVDDNSEEELRRRIAETPHANGHDWTFYFTVAPTEGVQRELERVLG
jgi:hypothetical protein